MILAALQNGEMGYAGSAVLLRTVYYLGCLGTAGLTFFALLFGMHQELGDAQRLRRWVLGAVCLGFLGAVGSLSVQVGILTGGETLTDPDIWHMVLASPAGASYGVGVAGLLLAVLLVISPRWRMVAAVGGILICASFTLLGHTTMLEPRLLAAGLLLLHLLVAAFWIGSLPPLAWSARREGRAAAQLVENWARLAAAAVPALAVAGVLLAWWTVGSLHKLVTSWYGWALLAKVALVAVLLGFAAVHRYRLTPALAAGTPGAGRRLALSITAEAIVALLVLYAAAELVSTSPESLMPSMGERQTGVPAQHSR